MEQQLLRRSLTFSPSLFKQLQEDAEKHDTTPSKALDFILRKHFQTQ